MRNLPSSGCQRAKAPVRILFAGSPAIAVSSLVAISEMELAGEGIILAGVLTNPDTKRGRHSQCEPTDISAAALKLDVMRKEKGLPPITQLKAEKLNAAAREEAAVLKADLLVSFAYGKIFGPKFLALFPLGGINIHPSLLPKYRGASPISSVILDRKKTSGICIQRLAPEMDSGDILSMERFKLSGRETTLSLSETVGCSAAGILKKLLSGYAAKAARAKPQKGKATYCKEIKKEEGLINWRKSAVSLDAQIRAFTPWPLSFTRSGSETLFILEAEPFIENTALKALPGTVLRCDKTHGILIQTGSGILAVKRLQWQAKKSLDWKAFCNGTRDFAGNRLG